MQTLLNVMFKNKMFVSGETVIQEQETQNKECIIQTDSFVPFVESQNSEIKRKYWD